MINEILKYKEGEDIVRLIDSIKSLNISPKVVIRCITYNHEKYIAEALEGFLKQKTNFPYIALVHDDASLDGTANIIKTYYQRYSEKIFPICDKVNRYKEGSLYLIMDAMIDAFNPQYIAICEGDDYWTDPYKLQTQVDYMDANPECVMCHGDYELVSGLKRKVPTHYENEPYFGPGHKHLYSISSLTTLYRYSTYKKIPNHRISHQWRIGDYPLWIELSKEGSFHYIPKVFGKYRVLSNSASHSTDCKNLIKLWNCRNEIVEFYSQLYGYPVNKPNLKTLYEDIQRQCFDNKDKEQARYYWKESKAKKSVSLKSMLFYTCNIYNCPSVIDGIYKIIR